MVEDLIYDVGANNGDDTQHYLSQGYRVLAIEANPALARAILQRFDSTSAAERLVVLNVGIWETDGSAPFVINDDHDEYSSFVPDVGARDGSRSHVIEVPTRTFSGIVAQFGTPHYLKIDIETADGLCLDALTPADPPTYVSIEAHTLDYLHRLTALGYRRFKAVDQSSHGWSHRTFNNATKLGRLGRRTEILRRRALRRIGRGPEWPAGSSGPFGEATPGPWRSAEEVSADWVSFSRRERAGRLNPAGWYDFHAAR